MYVVKELPKQRLYEKFVRLTLMKLTPGVNFTNILRVAFVQRYYFAKQLLSRTVI